VGYHHYAILGLAILRDIVDENINYQVVEDRETLVALTSLEQTVWQMSPEKSNSPASMMAAVHNGGLTLGAFAGERLIGFSFAFPGYRNGEVYLWSHQTGVLQEYRGTGIGKELKFKQREWARDYGYETIRWTFDPLQHGNARFNLKSLGTIVNRYLPNCYGTPKSGLNKGLPTDRYELIWHTDESQHAQHTFVYDQRHVLVQNGVLLSGVSDSDVYFLEIPENIGILKQTNLDAAQAWQMAIREATTQLLAWGYVICGYVEHAEHGYYAATRL
jgi:predicted GNAT superfamily acetyltransferase